jgi:hypothetical protein
VARALWQRARASEGLEDLREPGRPAVPGHSRGQPRGARPARSRRVPGVPRALGMRQEHDPQHRGRPLQGDHGAGPSPRQAHRGAGARSRHGVPELQLLPLAHRSRQRGLRPEATRGREGGAGADRASLDQEGRALRVREEIPGPAFRRHAATRGHRPHSRGQAPDHPDGRAFRALDVQIRLGMQNLINELWEEIEGRSCS